MGSWTRFISAGLLSLFIAAAASSAGAQQGDPPPEAPPQDDDTAQEPPPVVDEALPLPTAGPPATGYAVPPGYGPPEPPLQEAPPADPVTPERPAPTTTELPSGEQDLRYMDANADRVVLFSTAETHPAGTFFFTNYELILSQLGYAISDRVQLALTSVLPVTESRAFFLDLTLKANFLRQRTIRAAAIGALDMLVNEHEAGDVSWGVRLGAVGQVCLGTTCQSSLNLNLHTFLNDRGDDYLPLLTSLGFIGRISSLVAFLVEPSYAFIIGDVRVADAPEEFFISYGVRFSGANWGAEVTFIRPIYDGYEEDSDLIMGLPWFTVTYRSAGDPTEHGGAPPVATTQPGTY